MHGVPQGVSISILITTVMPEEVTTTVENYQDACRNGIEKMETSMCFGCVRGQRSSALQRHLVILEVV